MPRGNDALRAAMESVSDMLKELVLLALKEVVMIGGGDIDECWEKRLEG